jgi:SAM-dependent methyltransferase
MCHIQTRSTHESDDYGEKLYSDKSFDVLFPGFGVKQKTSAELIWDRILSRCGKDPDLPRIDRVVDYGCGEGTFLKYLVASAGKTRLKFYGLDCSLQAIAKAKRRKVSATFAQCDPCPAAALLGKNPLPLSQEDWQTTALLIMGHTWFHFDQECLTKTILELRPALLLVDVHSTWDSTITQIGRKNEIPEDGRDHAGGGTLWLKTKRTNRADERVRRGIWLKPQKGKGEWFFQTYQAKYTTDDIFGGLEKTRAIETEIERDPGKILNKGRSSGRLVQVHKGDKEVGYIRKMSVPHESGWGAMECSVLIARDPLAGLLNESFFQVVEAVIKEAIVDKAPHAKRIQEMLSLFNDPDAANDQIPASREALVILPFDPCPAFAKIVPLFHAIKSPISAHPLLIEQPSQVQTHYPSANGLFQTCLARSSSAQAFPTHWASAYKDTAVDLGIQKLELEVFGLNTESAKGKKKGCWRDEQDDPSYFMLPIYFGSLPLFCLALKFPKPFDPTTTTFDVFYSTLKSLHDGIHVLLTDDIVRRRIFRPWIESCLEADWKSFGENLGVEDKLDRMEKYLFGNPQVKSDPADNLEYRLDESTFRTGGVLGREWKSWVLGLPSYPIKKMASVEATNKRLWEIWKKERDFANKDAVLQISHWFQEGQFFRSDKNAKHDPHEKWISNIHSRRLEAMFELLRVKGSIPTSELGKQYFGEHTVNHYVFQWMWSKVRLLLNSDHGNTCSQGTFSESGECPHENRYLFDDCCKGKIFTNLKAVFCKNRGNEGDGVRFSIERLVCHLHAATTAGVVCLGGHIPPQKGFLLRDDPTLLLGDFARRLFAMEANAPASKRLLKSITVKCPNAGEAQVVICIENELSKEMGGEDFRPLYECFVGITRLPGTKMSPSEIYDTRGWIFSLALNSIP